MPPMKPPKKPKSASPPEFAASQRLQRMYEHGIRQITGRVLLPKAKEQTLAGWLAALAERSRQPDIAAASELLARRMVTAANVGNLRTWREAARKSTQSRQLHSLLMNEMQGPTGARVAQLIRENAQLISSVPLVAAQTLTDEVTKAQQNGARPSTVSKMMKQRFPELLKSRTNLISRTETAKASTALTQARCERLNLEWFEWETSKDKRTRESHKAMNGVLCSWGDLPSPEALIGEPSYGPYAPGGTFNCRCLVLPLLSLDDVAWPHRVYHGGTVTMMTLPAFKKLNGGNMLAETA
jgi:SPP1 gp7 family putative phage head morphogenesis protein